MHSQPKSKWIGFLTIGFSQEIFDHVFDSIFILSKYFSQMASPIIGQMCIQTTKWNKKECEVFAYTNTKLIIIIVRC